MIVVDTSVWIDYFNVYPSDEAAYLMLCIAEGQELVIPGLVLAELLLGARGDIDAARIRHVMSAFDLAPELVRADYEQAAALYRACRARGTTPRSTIDCLIARLCLKHGYQLLARDRDFVAIAQVSELRLIVPSSSVQERAAQYAPLGVRAMPAQSVVRAEVPLTRRRVSAPRRSSRASAPRSRASRR